MVNTSEQTLDTPPDAAPDTRATFYGDALGVRDARRWVAEHVAGHRRSGDIAAVTSELASNAATHTASAGGRFTVTLEHDATGVAVVVGDRGSQSQPRVQTTVGQAEHGHGMRLVAALADGWGTAARSDGRDVWAWFDGAAVRGDVER